MAKPMENGERSNGKPEALRVKPGGSPKGGPSYCSQEPKNPRHEAGGFPNAKNPNLDSPC